MFIGQEHILQELQFYIERGRQGIPYNLMFSARSGYGKTFLGLQVVARVATWDVLIEEEAERIVNKLDPKRAFAVLIDEVHIVKNIELLYPVMDAEKYFLIFATNQSFSLPEAFKRRCIPLIFRKYTETELCEIAKMNLSDIDVDPECYRRIVRVSNGTPGNIKLLCIRLGAIFSREGKITYDKLEDVLRNVMDIQDGLDARCREYLEVLNTLGTASISSLSNTLGLDESTIKNEIESILLQRGKIKISQKGRSII